MTCYRRRSGALHKLVLVRPDKCEPVTQDNGAPIGQNVVNQERAERLHIVTRFRLPYTIMELDAGAPL
jgi:hypothetical protein